MKTCYEYSDVRKFECSPQYIAFYDLQETPTLFHALFSTWWSLKV